MKNKILIIIVAAVMLLFASERNFGQTIDLGAAANFVIFTKGGSVHDNASAHSNLTGDVGYETSGDFLGFGNVNGVMHPGVDAATTAAGLAVLSAVAQINSAVDIYYPGLLLGNGVVFIPGVYSIPGNATLNLNLILDAQTDPNAVFIIKIQGTFSTNAGSKVILINGAQACNVFWKVEGLVDMATNTTMRGTIIANNAAINMATGDSLEGRLLSTTGAITIDKITAFTPTGCGSLVLTGPASPTLGTIACFTIFASIGALDGGASSTSIGDVGNNGIGSITGWSPSDVTGTLHLIQDPATIQAATDLSNLYDELNALIPDIELLYPAQFGNDLVLTPHTYLMDGSSAEGPATFTGSLYLDAQGNADAVFVIKIIGGAITTTSTYAKVILINGAQAKNVFWMVQGAVSINNYSEFAGTIVVPVGAINLVNTGVVLDGRALAMNGAITTAGMAAAMPPGCGSASPPVITTEPNIQTACLGSSVSFTVTATGDNLTYQWRNGSVNLIDGGNISGATTATLIINPVTISDTSSFYNVIVSGSVLPNDTSIYVSLMLDSGSVIINEPMNQTVCIGDSAGFTVSATGTGLTYQWRKGNIDLIDGGNISGATSDTLVINPVNLSDTASNYNVVVSGTCPPNDTSIFVSLKLGEPFIVTEPADQIACDGGTASFSVVATGTGLTYQWRKGTLNLINNAFISGANSDTLTINPVGISDASSSYNVIVSGTCGANDTSINATLVINTAPVISIEPTDQVACIGGSVSFSVAVNGVDITYQWRRGNIDLINGGNITDATSDTLTINPVNLSDIASNYNVIVSGSCGVNDTSIFVSLISGEPNIISNPVNQTVCIGDSAIFFVNATGIGLTYQWRKGNIDLINGGNISGATSDTLVINPVNLSDTASNYNVIITGTCSPNDTSLYVSLNLNNPNIFSEPVSQTTCPGSSVSFNVASSGTGLTYQWRNGTVNLINGGNISGATTATLTINPVSISDTSSNYNVIISGLCSINDTSVNVFLHLNNPSIFTEPVDQIGCAGGSASFSVASTGTGLTYQWRNGSVNLIDGGNISGATTATLTINPVSVTDTSSNYNVVITGLCSPNDTSIYASLTLSTVPVITSEPADQVACAGSLVSFSVTATGAGLTYQWRKGNVNLVNGGNIFGATFATLIINPANISDTSTVYNVLITGACAVNDTSVNVSLIINSYPIITTEPVDQVVCAGSSVSFSVATTGATLTYQWRKGSVNLTNGGNISGANSSVLTINPANISDTSTVYNVVISGACTPNVTSVNVSLTLNSPNIISQPANQTACLGGSVSFTVASAGTGLTYQWRNGIVNLVNGGNISGATSDVLTISPVNFSDTSSNYNVVITGACIPVATSNNVSLAINSPLIITEPVDQTACAGSSVSFTVLSSGTGLTYQWKKGSVDLINGGNISGVTTATLTINPVNISDAAANYYVVINGTCAPTEYSVNVALVINILPNIITEPVSQTVCDDNSVSFAVSATGTGLNYQWKKGSSDLANGGNISGATSATLTINPVTLSDAAANYYVVITGTCLLNDTSVNVALTVFSTPFAAANGNTPVCVGSPLNLTAETVTGATYTWTSTNGFTSTEQNPVIASATTANSGTYTLSVSANGCNSASADVVILVYKCIDIDFNIPEGFSPNADGINDLFVIRGIGFYPNNSIVIFNRWGDKIFEANPYLNNWSGNATKGIRLGGDELPVGTYFYILNLGDDSEVIKGTVYLNRQK